MELDDYTKKHFQEWLDRKVRLEDQEFVHDQIMTLLESDPSLLDGRGWTELRDMAGAW